MKRAILAITLSALFLACLPGGCGKAAPGGRDRTVTIDGAIAAPPEDAVAVVGQGEADTICSSDPEDLLRYTETVVQGTVLDVSYTHLQGNAWTKVDLAVEQVVGGDCAVGDRITIMGYGGYISIADHIAGANDAFRFSNIPEEQWKTTYMKQLISGDTLPQTGDRLLYCLVKTPEEQGFPKGTFSRLSHWGIFAVDQNGRLTQNATKKTYTAARIQTIAQTSLAAK